MTYFILMFFSKICAFYSLRLYTYHNCVRRHMCCSDKIFLLCNLVCLNIDLRPHRSNFHRYDNLILNILLILVLLKICHMLTYPYIFLVCMIFLLSIGIRFHMIDINFQLYYIFLFYINFLIFFLGYNCLSRNNILKHCIFFLLCNLYLLGIFLGRFSLIFHRQNMEYC